MKSTAVLLEQQDTVEIGKAPHQHSKSDEVPIQVNEDGTANEHHEEKEQEVPQIILNPPIEEI